MKIWLLDHNSIMADLRGEFEIVSKLEDADEIVIWNDVNPVERGIVKYAHSLGKPVIAMQHGRRGTSKYFPPFNEKIRADKLLVWGELDRRCLVDAGQDPRKISVVGTTLFSHIKAKKEHAGTNLVFSPEHWDRPIVENEDVRNRLRKLKGRINVITKLIDSPSHDGVKFDNAIKTNRDDDGHIDTCFEVLSTADIVVGISESTFELMAQAMNIPVVIMSEWQPRAFGGDERYVGYRRLISPASKKATIKTLLNTIEGQLNNPRELELERKQIVIDEGGFGLNSLGLIKKEIWNTRITK